MEKEALDASRVAGANQLAAVKGRLFALTLVGIAVFLLLWSFAAPWGASWTSGQRYKLHLWGISPASSSHATTSPVQPCHWFTVQNGPGACERADGAGMRYLLVSLALPAMLLAFTCAMLSALVIARGSVARLTFARSVLPLLMAATVLVLASILLLTWNVQGALRVFQTSAVGLEGTGLAAANAGLVALAIALLISRSFRASLSASSSSDRRSQ